MYWFFPLLLLATCVHAWTLHGVPVSFTNTSTSGRKGLFLVVSPRKPREVKAIVAPGIYLSSSLKGIREYAEYTPEMKYPPALGLGPYVVRTDTHPFTHANCSCHGMTFVHVECTFGGSIRELALREDVYWIREAIPSQGRRPPGFTTTSISLNPAFTGINQTVLVSGLGIQENHCTLPEIRMYGGAQRDTRLGTAVAGALAGRPCVHQHGFLPNVQLAFFRIPDILIHFPAYAANVHCGIWEPNDPYWLDYLAYTRPYTTHMMLSGSKNTLQAPSSGIRGIAPYALEYDSERTRADFFMTDVTLAKATALILQMHEAYTRQFHREATSWVIHAAHLAHAWDPDWNGMTFYEGALSVTTERSCMFAFGYTGEWTLALAWLDPPVLPGSDVEIVNKLEMIVLDALSGKELGRGVRVQVSAQPIRIVILSTTGITMDIQYFGLHIRGAPPRLMECQGTCLPTEYQECGEEGDFQACTLQGSWSTCQPHSCGNMCGAGCARACGLSCPIAHGTGGVSQGSCVPQTCHPRYTPGDERCECISGSAIVCKNGTKGVCIENIQEFECE